MKYQQLANDFAVAGQITVDDVPEIAAAGYRCLICNRPDHEDAGQPTVADIRAACEQHGIELKVRETSGAEENLRLLEEDADGGRNALSAKRLQERREYVAENRHEAGSRGPRLAGRAPDRGRYCTGGLSARLP